MPRGSPRRDPRRRERSRERVRLATATFLSRPQEHRTLRAHQHGVVDVDRIGVAGIVRRHDDLGACGLEERAKLLVLGGCGGVVGRSPPAVLAPALGVFGEWRPDEDALEAPRHGLRAERAHAQR